MKLARGTGLVVALALVAAGLRIPPAATAPGDVDLEVTVSGSYIADLQGNRIEWTVTITNSLDDEAIATTATGVQVRDVLSDFNITIPPRINIAFSAGGSYSAGLWTTGSIAPGASKTLSFWSAYSADNPNNRGTLSAEVVAAGQGDRDSSPDEDSDVGDEDDESIWNANSNKTQEFLGDFVWNDQNGNGLQDGGEPGVRGAMVIISVGGVKIYARRTDNAGLYRYTGLDKNEVYTVRFVPPIGYSLTAQGAGADAINSDPNPTTGTTEPRQIAKGGDLNLDAGLLPGADLSVAKSVVPTTGPATLLASYSVDVTNSGPGPASSVEVTDTFPVTSTLVPGSISVTQGSTVSGSGTITWTAGQVAVGTATLSYQLEHPVAGSQQNRAQITASGTPDPDSIPHSASTTCAEQPSDDDCATASVTVTAGTGSLAGIVWRDTNEDGQRQSGEERQAGATVRRLSSGGALLDSTVTSGTGSWTFANLSTGNYIIEVIAPNGATFTQQDTGSDSSDSDVGSDGRVSASVSAGQTTNWDAGLVRSDSPIEDSTIVPQGIGRTINVLDNDQIPGRTAGGPMPAGWTFDRTDGPEWGSVSCDANGACTFASIESFAGEDTFSYTVVNPLYGSTEVAVRIEVLHVNDSPVARIDRAVTEQSQPVLIDVTANDEDPNDPPTEGDPNRPGDPPTISSWGNVGPAGSGSVDCTATACTFTPAATFTGPASFTYTITDSGISDERVDDPGVPGGIPAMNPLAAEQTAYVWVDPQRRPDEQFTARVSEPTTTGSGPWLATTNLLATASCVGGRPRVQLSWNEVDKATGYLIERRPLGSAGPWYRLTKTSAGTTVFNDDLVGEGRYLEYQVVPIRHLLSGQPSGIENARAPVTTGPQGC